LHGNNIQRSGSRDRTEYFVNDSVTSANESDSNQRMQYFGDVYSVGGMAEYHLPLGMRWQFDVMTEALLPQKQGSNALLVRNQAGATFLIDDRWRADLRFQHGRQILKKSGGTLSGGNDSWWTEALFGLSYYIEDRTSINLTAQQTQTARTPGGYLGIVDNSTPDNQAFGRIYSLTLGVSYHFLGGLEAPGIVPRSSLMR
jgi:hypothetical protein